MNMTGEGLVRAVAALAKILGYQLAADGRLINVNTGSVYDDVPDGEKLRAALARGDISEMRRILAIPSEPR